MTPREDEAFENVMEEAYHRRALDDNKVQWSDAGGTSRDEDLRRLISQSTGEVSEAKRAGAVHQQAAVLSSEPARDHKVV